MRGRRPSSKRCSERTLVRFRLDNPWGLNEPSGHELEPHQLPVCVECRLRVPILVAGRDAPNPEARRPLDGTGYGVCTPAFAAAHVPGLDPKRDPEGLHG